MTNKPFKFMLIIIIIFFSNDIFAYERPKDKLYVKYTNGLITIFCENVPIDDLFLLIGKKTNIEYKIYNSIKKRKITASIEELNFDMALKKLLNENYAIIYSASSKIPEKVYILDKSLSNYKYDLINAFHEEKFPEVNLIKAAVIDNVKKVHPNAVFYEMIEHYDIYGNLKSYVFTFFKGNGEMPTKDILMNDISTAWIEKKKALNQIHEGYMHRDNSKIHAAAQKSINASSRIAQEDRFITLEIGANYSDPPIIARWDGLPLDISQFPRALDVANTQLSDKKPNYKQTYTAGLGKIVFAFATAGETYYIETGNWRVLKSINIRKTTSAYSDNNRPEKNKLKWASFLDL